MKSLRCTAIVCAAILGIVGVNHIAMAKAKIPPYKVTEVKNGGTIVGTVTFEGDVPEVKMLKVDKDEQTCGHENKPSEELLIDEGTMAIKNVVVSLADITEGKEPDNATAILDQKGCEFIPHVLAISAGTEVDILNSDDVMHNLHSWSIRNPAFNEGVSGGSKLTKKFEIPETVKITCDVHKWMSSFVVVKHSPYFDVTGEDGRFKIGNVPPGTYKIEAWQEKLGKRKVDVTVKPGEEVEVNFVFSKKKRR